MGINGYPLNFNPSQQLVNPQGAPTTVGSRFFLYLYNRTGAGNGFPSVSLGLIAAGNNQATGLLLTSDWNEVDTTAAGTGVVIPVIAQGGDIIVWNIGAHALDVFPPNVFATPVQIDGLGVNNAYSLASNKMQWFRQTAYNQIRSMQLG